MRLAAGTRPGSYEITGAVGAGGMGEVYRARDTRLQRDVALKVLPEAFAANSQRLARFAREAQVLASLNHPHIAHIYGIEEAGGASALMMELVEGEDLAERIRRGPLPPDEALPIARQLAEALEAAHERGVIHRDLKPANFRLTPTASPSAMRSPARCGRSPVRRRPSGIGSAPTDASSFSSRSCSTRMCGCWS